VSAQQFPMATTEIAAGQRDGNDGDVEHNDHER